VRETRLLTNKYQFLDYGCSKIWLIMVYQLLTTFTTYRNSGTISIILLLTNTLAASATEYVFTAPPEVNRQIVEIPARDTEYPLYECNAKTVAEADRALDAHDCSCTDCDNKLKQSQLDRSYSTSTSNSTSKRKVEQP
jgi:hypothetical protein